MKTREAYAFARSNTRMSKLGSSVTWALVGAGVHSEVQLFVLPQTQSAAKIGVIMLRGSTSLSLKPTEQSHIEAEELALSNYEKWTTEIENNDFRFQREDGLSGEKLYARQAKYKAIYDELKTAFNDESVAALGQGFLEVVESQIATQKLDVLLVPLVSSDPNPNEEDNYKYLDPLFAAGMASFFEKKLPKAAKLKMRKVTVKMEDLKGFTGVNSTSEMLLKQKSNKFGYCYNPKKIESLQKEFFSGDLFLPDFITKITGAGEIAGSKMTGASRVLQQATAFRNVDNLSEYNSNFYGDDQNDRVFGNNYKSRYAHSKITMSLVMDLHNIQRSSSYQYLRQAVVDGLLKMADMKTLIEDIEKSINDGLQTQRNHFSERKEILQNHNARMEKGRTMLKQMQKEDEEITDLLLNDPTKLISKEEQDQYILENYPNPAEMDYSYWGKGVSGREEYVDTSTEKGRDDLLSPWEFVEKYQDTIRSPAFQAYARVALTEDIKATHEYEKNAPEGSLRGFKTISKRLIALRQVHYYNQQRKKWVESSPISEAEAEEWANSIKFQMTDSVKNKPNLANKIEPTKRKVRKVLKDFYRVVNGNVDNKKFDMVKLWPSNKRASADRMGAINIKVDESDHTIFHELTHHLEFQHSDVYQAGQMFLMEKVTSLKKRGLKTIEKKERDYQHDFNSSEKGFPTGGAVSEAYMAKSYGSGADSSEVITMCLQDFMAGPDQYFSFYRNLKKYPDEIAFSCALLQGLRDGDLGNSRRALQEKDDAKFEAVMEEECIRKRYVPRVGNLNTRDLAENWMTGEMILKNSFGTRVEFTVGKTLGAEDLGASSVIRAVPSMNLLQRLKRFYLESDDSPDAEKEFKTVANLRLRKLLFQETRFFSSTGAPAGKVTEADGTEVSHYDLLRDSDFLDFCRDNNLYVVEDYATENERWHFERTLLEKSDFKLFERTEFPLIDRFDSSSENMRK